MSAFTRPILIGADKASFLLERVPLTFGAEGQYSEQWLQQTLFAHPLSLPIQEIDPHAGALIPICMELGTDAGPADILYVTRTGQVVLVETKLWRNAEARREVVAQILDYAKELSGWTYAELSRRAAIATKGGSGYLLQQVKAAHADLDEAAFEDGINRSLKSGDFLLIIAGDGIRYGAEALVGFIERYGYMRFTLALVETAAYLLPGGAMLLQPRILAKTETLRRTVFVAQATSSAADALEMRASPAEDEKLARNEKVAERLERFWGEYLHELKLDDTLQPPPERPSRSTNMVLYLPPGRGKAWISAYLAQSSDQAGVFLTFASSFSDSTDWYARLQAQRDLIAEVVPGLTWECNSEGKVWIEVPPTRIGNLDDKVNRRRIVSYLAEQTNRMVNAFRHRLEALAREQSPT